jgi:hypothetical protein
MILTLTSSQLGNWLCWHNAPDSVPSGPSDSACTSLTHSLPPCIKVITANGMGAGLGNMELYNAALGFKSGAVHMAKMLLDGGTVGKDFGDVATARGYAGKVNFGGCALLFLCALPVVPECLLLALSAAHCLTFATHRLFNNYYKTSILNNMLLL